MTTLEADNFKNDWYGWITNQCGHVVLGLVLFCFLMMLSFLSGEFASRWVVWSSIGLSYIVWEFIIQRGYKWDSVEDCIFVCGYGAGLPALVMHEVVPGSPVFHGNILHVVPVLGMFCFHATLGVTLRLIGQSRS